MITIFAHISMIVSVVFYAWSLFVKTKSKLFLLETISTVFFALQYAFLFAWVGMIIAIVDMIRVGIFFFLEKYNCSHKSKVITIIISYIIALILSIVTWAGWYCIIPLIGLTLMYLFTVIPNLTLLKISIVFNVLCTTVYLFFLGSVFNMVLEIILLIACIIGTAIDIVKDSRKKKAKI